MLNGKLEYTGKSNITITLKGSGGEKIITERTGCIFIVKNGVTLILDGNITLQGKNSSGTVSIGEDGALVMNTGAKIIGGNNRGVYMTKGGATFTMNGGEISGSSSAVYIKSNSIFTMNGGTIYNNNSSDTYNATVYIHDENAIFTINGGSISGNNGKNGGGVYEGKGNFIMNGGTISGNTAENSGGGILVGGGTFRINNGIVYDSEADTDKANKAPPPVTLSPSGYIAYSGASLSLIIISNGIAKYGTGSTWTDIPVNTIGSSIGGRDTTIKVVNGVLQ